MEKKIVSFIEELKSNKKLASFDEASTKQAVVLRLLSFLGWDIFNVEEVYPDYSVNSTNVSYALRIKNTNKVFIEVKRIHAKLDNHQKALVNLSSREDINMAVLTNGITWWFYLISTNGSWQRKWFYSIDLIKQKPDSFVPNLIDLISKTKVAKGQSLKAAKSLFQRKRQKLAANFLPEAWNQIISQPNKIFVELLSEQTEKLCRYKVDAKSIQKFLDKHMDKWLVKSVAGTGAAPPSATMATDILDLDSEMSSVKLTAPPKKEPMEMGQSFTDKSIRSFRFNGKNYPVRAWDEVLPTLCEYFASTNTKDFEKVLWISDDQKTCFSRYSDQLRIPEKIKRTDIFVETKMTPDEVVKTAKKLLVEFGYDRNDLSIDAR
ncbi:restriction endonuclease subunit R [Thermodesulfobacteriota bacterium]